MIAPKDCAAIILAAGRSERFGPYDKLLARFEGRPLIDHILASVAEIGFGQVVVVVSNEGVAEIAKGHGFEIVRVAHGSPQGASVRAGAAALGACRAAMMFLGDMPHVTPDHIVELLAQAEVGGSVASRSGPYLGPPAVFPPALLLGVGPDEDRGARHLLAEARVVDVVPEVVRDYDVRSDFSGR